MKQKARTVIGCLLVLFILAILLIETASAQEKKSITLNYAVVFPPTGVYAEGIKWWAGEVNKRTEGSLTIKIHWGGALARSMEMAEAVRTGTADIGDTVWAPYLPEKLPMHIIADYAIPFHRKPLASWLAVEQLAKEFPEFDGELAANNMRRLTYYGVGNPHLITRKEIRTIGDLKGMKIRCSGKIHPNVLKAVGVVPMFIPSAEAYDALHKGVVDGSTCTSQWAVDYKYYEAARYLTKVGLGGDPGMGAMINLDVWKKLPKQIQEVLLKLREEYPIVYAEADYKQTEMSYPILTNAGVKIVDPPASELETWKNLPQVKALPEEWAKFAADKAKVPLSRTNEILKRYGELREKFGKLYPKEW